MTQLDTDAALWCKADGVTDDSAALETAAKTAAKEHGRLFLKAGTYVVDQNIVLPASITLAMEDGAVLQVNDGASLIISSDLRVGNGQIFSGEGKITVRSVTAGNPLWFGAKGDGVSDDTKAFKKAFACFDQLEVPVPEVAYVLGGMDTFAGMAMVASFEAEGRIPVRIAQGAEYLFRTSTGNGAFKVNGFAFDCAAMPAESTVFYFNTSTGWIQDSYVENCTFTDAYHIFKDDNHRAVNGKSALMYMHFNDLECLDNRNTSFMFHDLEGYIFFKNLLIDNSQSYAKHSLTQGFSAIYVQGVAGNILENVTVIGGNTGSKTEHGMVYNKIASVWWDRVTVKNCSGAGVEISNANLASFVSTEFSRCGTGLSASVCNWFQLEEVVARDCKGNGLSVSTGNWTQINNCTASNNEGNGLQIIGCVNAQICNGIFTDNERYGATLSGTAVSLVDSRCSGNKSGSYHSTATAFIAENIAE